MKTTAPKIVIPDRQERARLQAAEELLAERQYAKEIAYDRKARAFNFIMRSGASITIPLAAIREFDDATPLQLTRVKLGLGGGSLEQDELDVHISVPGLLREVFGFTEQQRRAGSAKSAAKSTAARANGAKGGRPRKAVSIEAKS